MYIKNTWSDKMKRLIFMMPQPQEAGHFIDQLLEWSKMLLVSPRTYLPCICSSTAIGLMFLQDWHCSQQRQQRPNCWSLLGSVCSYLSQSGFGMAALMSETQEAVRAQSRMDVTTWMWSKVTELTTKLINKLCRGDKTRPRIWVASQKPAGRSRVKVACVGQKSTELQT